MKYVKIVFLCLLIIVVILIINIVFKDIKNESFIAPSLTDQPKPKPKPKPTTKTANIPDPFKPPENPFLRCKVNDIKEDQIANKLNEKFYKFNKQIATHLEENMLHDKEEYFSKLAFYTYNNKDKSEKIKKKISSIIINNKLN